MNLLEKTLVGVSDEVVIKRFYTAQGSGVLKCLLTVFTVLRVAVDSCFGRSDAYYISSGSGKSFVRKMLYVSVLALFRRRFIFHMHGGLFEEWASSLGRLEVLIYSLLLNEAERLYCLNALHEKVFVEVFGVSEKKLRRVNNFVVGGSNEFISDKDKDIVFIGMVDTSKGVDVLVQAFSSIDTEYRLRLFGPMGDLQKSEQVQEYYEGVLEEEKWDVLSKAAIFVLPSKFENFPLTVIESTRSSCLLVYTGAGFVDDVYSRGEDYLHTELSVSCLAEVLLNITEDFEKYSTQRHKGFVKSMTLTGIDFAGTTLRDLGV